MVGRDGVRDLTVTVGGDKRRRARSSPTNTATNANRSSGTDDERSAAGHLSPQPLTRRFAGRGRRSGRRHGRESAGVARTAARGGRGAGADRRRRRLAGALDRGHTAANAWRPRRRRRRCARRTACAASSQRGGPDAERDREPAAGRRAGRQRRSGDAARSVADRAVVGAVPARRRRLRPVRRRGHGRS